MRTESERTKQSVVRLESELLAQLTVVEARILGACNETDWLLIEDQLSSAQKTVSRILKVVPLTWRATDGE